ncbi:MAG: LysM peptidoglycan-binding domain-containing protein [Bacilli bacterium]
MTTYTVMPGDNIWSIARKYGISVNDLLTTNPQIIDPTLIFPGQTINIPSNNNSTYMIVPGDTLWSIARKYGIGVNDLLAANPQITNPARIFSGQTINIPKVPSEPSDIKALETEVIRLVNTERTKVGSPPLTPNNELNRVARIKSEDFVKNNYFSHNSPTYGTPFDMLRSFGITFTAAGENIAKGQRTAQEVMNTWMNSSGHRANILNPTYNQIGVGVARDNNGNLLWTQIFIRS